MNNFKKAGFLFLMLVISCEAFAIHQIFNLNNEPIDQNIAAAFKFPADLNKTNLNVVPMGPGNPFEWSGPLWTQRRNYKYPCTGGVISLKNSKPEDKVLIITAGHCVTSRTGDFLKPKEVLLNQIVTPGEIWFEFPRDRVFSIKDTNNVISKSSRRFEVTKILFASFDAVDLALLEMDLSYKDLDYKNQQPPVLAVHELNADEAVRAFGIPNSDDYTSAFFHQADCKIISHSTFTSEIKNVDPTTPYLFQDRISSTCTLFGGMSGGYVRNSQGLIVAVNGAVLSTGYSLLNSTMPLARCLNSAESEVKTDCLEALAHSISNRK